MNLIVYHGLQAAIAYDFPHIDAQLLNITRHIITAPQRQTLLSSRLASPQELCPWQALTFPYFVLGIPSPSKH